MKLQKLSLITVLTVTFFTALVLVTMNAVAAVEGAEHGANHETGHESGHEAGHDVNHEAKSEGHAVHHDPTAPMMKGGANLNLFPPPQANPSKVARPAKPELVEPAYRAQITGGTVNLKWSKVNSADAYHLQVATDPNFKWLVINQEILNGNSFQLNDLKKGEHYFWRVAALKTDNDPTYMKGWFSLSTFETANQ
jgi:hypothetical protein